jgi:hypothetical protein
MEKEKRYLDVKFSPEVISEAGKILDSFLEGQKLNWSTRIRKVSLTEIETWTYDTDEEFFSDYRKNQGDSQYFKSARPISFNVSFNFRRSTVDISANDRKTIEAVFEVFERNAEKCKLPPLPPKPKPSKPKPQIFIGHGGSAQWRDLKDHLHEKHKGSSLFRVGVTGDTNPPGCEPSHLY